MFTRSTCVFCTLVLIYGKGRKSSLADITWLYRCCRSPNLDANSRRSATNPKLTFPPHAWLNINCPRLQIVRTGQTHWASIFHLPLHAFYCWCLVLLLSRKQVESSAQSRCPSPVPGSRSVNSLHLDLYNPSRSSAHLPFCSNQIESDAHTKTIVNKSPAPPAYSGVVLVPRPWIRSGSQFGLLAVSGTSSLRIAASLRLLGLEAPFNQSTLPHQPWPQPPSTRRLMPSV